MMDNSDKQLGNYRILKMLGQGGFADVYLGEHIHLHTQAAIKVLRTQLADDAITQFQNEALVIAHLVHPHIIRILDFDAQNATPFLVMDYAPGGTLRQAFPRGTPVAPARFLPYVQQVASALQYAHEQKLIHRDVKPENMLLMTEEDVKLSDFGIALVARSTLSQEQTGDVLGTMAYMAPEQLQGKARPASDQYALAVVVYEWLTGDLPFRGSYMEMISQHLTTPPPLIDEQLLSLPHEVAQVLYKALSKDPHERFPRIQDFADALFLAYDGGTFEGLSTLLANPQRAAATTGPELPFSAIADAPSEQTTIEPVLQQAPSTTPAKQTITRTPPSIPRSTVATFGKRLTSTARGCARASVLLFIVLPLLLCGLAFAGYTSVINRNPPTQAAALANNFASALANHNYDLAYNDLGSNLTRSVSHDNFILNAQNEDRCYGPITGEQQANASSINSNQVYDYTFSRAKLAHPYHLHITVSKDWLGNWSISDYNSDAGIGLPPCR